MKDALATLIGYNVACQSIIMETKCIRKHTIPMSARYLSLLNVNFVVIIFDGIFLTGIYSEVVNSLNILIVFWHRS
jgi:hypothetical protein